MIRITSPIVAAGHFVPRVFLATESITDHIKTKLVQNFSWEKPFPPPPVLVIPEDSGEHNIKYQVELSYQYAAQLHLHGQTILQQIDFFMKMKMRTKSGENVKMPTNTLRDAIKQYIRVYQADCPPLMRSLKWCNTPSSKTPAILNSVECSACLMLKDAVGDNLKVVNEIVSLYGSLFSAVSFLADLRERVAAIFFKRK